MDFVVLKKIFALCFVLPFWVSAQVKEGLSHPRERYNTLTECTPEPLKEEILCGTLMVAENRKSGDKKIPINVYLFPATQPNPEGRVFLEYNGGPASPNENLLWLYEKGGPSYYLRKYADVLIIDQRGTGASKIPGTVYGGRQLSGRLFELDMVRRCLQESQESVALSHYSTGASVEDIEEVRAFLGIPKLEISGLSYGTRTALEYMRRYPENVGSLILTGTVSPEFGYAKHLDFEVEKQLQALISRCKTDTLCNRNFPDFGATLYDLRDQLKHNPITVDIKEEDGKSIQVVVNDTLYVRMVGQIFLMGNRLESLPLLINEFKNGNHKPLIKTNIRSTSRIMSVYLSQFCPDDIFNNRVNEEDYSELFTYGEMGLMEVRACQEWIQLPSPDWLKAPLRGDAPVLLLTGEMDTQTPPGMAEKVKLQLKNARHIVFPNEGHALISYSCWDTIVSQFLKSKNLWEIDSTCLKTIKRPNFKVSLN